MQPSGFSVAEQARAYHLCITAETLMQPVPNQRLSSSRREPVMKYIYPALPVLLAVVFLTGCPQSKTPDKPSLVPQPKAAPSMTGLF